MKCKSWFMAVILKIGRQAPTQSSLQTHMTFIERQTDSSGCVWLVLYEEMDVVSQAIASLRNSVMVNLFNRYICSQTDSWRERFDAENSHETLMHFCCANKRSRNTLCCFSLAASSKTCFFNGGIYCWPHSIMKSRSFHSRSLLGCQ